eukprot:TRINITY_DN4592_c0_g1_i1.p1 TRINITY_DN4592_c0_g1~~TRINITY_DN4592_c0_g1_i1.p1  ORF type:complete len:438 (-),score=86.74 TRINITY_DN4592_c0_g1_i1:12-1325(-)
MSTPTTSPQPLSPSSSFSKKGKLDESDLENVPEDEVSSSYAGGGGVDGGGEEKSAPSKGMIASLLSLFKKISVGTELSSSHMDMPEGLESNNSGLEVFQSNALRHSHLLLDVNNIEDPVLRMAQVVKWVLTLGRMFQNKKPLNPVLGEVSLCKYYPQRNADGEPSRPDENVFYSLHEQVSHHPPISVSATENKDQGIAIHTTLAPRIRFMGTLIRLTMEGETRISFEKHKEVYSYVPPPVNIRLVGLVLEYAGTVEITCNSYKARITYHEKPYLRGTFHKTEGVIVKMNPDASESGKGKSKKESDEEVLISFKGYWDKEINFEDHRTGQKSTFSMLSCPYSKYIPIYPTEEMPMSSRRVWYHRKHASSSTDGAKAKKEVEEEQRRLAKERTEKGDGSKWEPRYFTMEQGQEDESNSGGGKKQSFYNVKPGTLDELKF